MTYEYAKSLLHPDTMLEEVHKIDDFDDRVQTVEDARIKACEAIDKVLAMQWVPVSERLPEADFEEYIRINGEYPHYLVKIREGVTAAILDFDGENWTDDYYTPYNVTHWMPLPEPPKEDNK